ncbi:hypothetical protein BWK59_14995 [Flavobacterium davisii]|uniref:RHS repeat-associated core domain-containing protein n=1 Tax=Flavobacterium davisii TaxID=2906077 RepID=A0A246GEQ2_9FLAO|nr:hypothetical protein [Flavobacterium davisii]OWP82601.1 hypothetical protein BWK59_14995 [Flavobacterium davisii]
MGSLQLTYQPKLKTIHSHEAKSVQLWLSTDPLAEKFPNASPYNYCLNNPVNAIDPDGRLIIFINGMWGTGTGAIGGGTANHWGKKWISDAQNRIGDHNARFYDGSSDWTGKTGGMSRLTWNMDVENRYSSGYAQGGRDAASIVNSLERGSNGQITESIKIVTSSMGAAYSRGMTQAIVDYIDVQNKTIDAYNNSLEKDKKGNYLDSSKVKQRLNVTFEFTVDLDAFQANKVGADPNTNSNYFMKADGWESYFIGGKNVPESNEIGNSIMKHHHPSWAPTNRLPKGTMNPSSTKKSIENPTN